MLAMMRIGRTWQKLGPAELWLSIEKRASGPSPGPICSNRCCGLKSLPVLRREMPKVFHNCNISKKII
jgi:hypothetical protein